MNKGLIIVASLLFISCVYHDLGETMNCNLSGLSLSLDSVSRATSCSIADGAVYVSAMGGEPPYTYSINNQSTQLQNAFTGLASGVYSITVRDVNACEATFNNISLPAKDFQFASIVKSNSGCISANGSIEIAVPQEDALTFSFKLNDGSFSSTNVFTALKQGAYTVTVKNEGSCTIELKLSVPRANTGTSWSADVLPIIQSNCAISGCHNGQSRTNYANYNNAKKDAQDIKAKTQDRSMPFDGTLTQNEIDIISCWVDDGAIEN